MKRSLSLLGGILPAVIFFGMFALIGDVLIAATLAVATTIAQLVLIWSAHGKSGALIWVSLALVIGLGGVTLAGSDTSSLILSPTPISCAGVECVCHLPAQPI